MLLKNLIIISFRIFGRFKKKKLHPRASPHVQCSNANKRLDSNFATRDERFGLSWMGSFLHPKLNYLSIGTHSMSSP